MNDLRRKENFTPQPKLEFCKQCGKPLQPYQSRFCSINCFEVWFPYRSKYREKIYWYIAAHLLLHGISPTLAQIQAALNVKSKSQVHRVLLQLRKHGLLAWLNEGSGNLRNRGIYIPGMVTTLPLGVHDDLFGAMRLYPEVKALFLEMAEQVSAETGKFEG